VPFRRPATVRAPATGARFRDAESKPPEAPMPAGDAEREIHGERPLPVATPRRRRCARTAVARYSLGDWSDEWGRARPSGRRVGGWSESDHYRHPAAGIARTRRDASSRKPGMKTKTPRRMILGISRRRPAPSRIQPAGAAARHRHETHMLRSKSAELTMAYENRPQAQGHRSLASQPSQRRIGASICRAQFQTCAWVVAPCSIKTHERDRDGGHSSLYPAPRCGLKEAATRPRRMARRASWRPFCAP